MNLAILLAAVGSCEYNNSIKLQLLSLGGPDISGT